MSVPKLNVPQSKLDKLADDLQKLEIQTIVKVGPGQTPVPAFQRQGYLEKLGHARSKWFKRFFVLRDSFLLSYNLQKSDFTVEPRAAIHLGGSSIQHLDYNGKPFCFLITTMQRDRFIFSCETEAERNAWIKDLEESKTITHANMIKLAVENQCLAEEKGASQITRDNSASALAIFSNPEYIQNTPITGGAEGWLRTSGFNAEDLAGADKKGLFVKKANLEKCYFIQRDSHLMMFHGGDVLTKPRGAMYLLGTVTESIDVEGGEEGAYHFIVRSLQCGDQIGLVASSKKVRNRWIQALRIGARVTYPDFKVLLKEHELLSMLTMTPRAAPPVAPNKPAAKLDAPPVPLFHEVVDVQGEQLDPGTQQPYDEQGNPLIRTPEGKLVDVEGQQLPANAPRFGARGEQLDPFNRPLPPGAVPMFTAEGKPIGVGPDGKHYLPDGTEVDTAAPHFDADGAQLDEATIEAANAIAANVSVAIKVRTKMRGETDKAEAVDVLGRTFRDSQNAKDGVLINADGDAVPLASARHVETSTGNLVEYKPDAAAASGVELLKILVDNEGTETELGEVEVTSTMTLRDVRERIKIDLDPSFSEFVFLYNQAPLLKYEENDKLATAVLPEVTIRGKELKAVEPKAKFNKKLAEFVEAQQQKDAQQQEFQDILNRVRKGQFLRSVKDSILDN